MFIYNHSSHMLMSDTGLFRSKGEYWTLSASISLANSCPLKQKVAQREWCQMERMQQRGQNDVKRMSAMWWRRERSSAAGATVCLRFGYTHPRGNKDKLKGGELRNHERDNMFDFGIGVGWRWVGLSPIHFIFVSDFKKSIIRRLG